MDDKLNGTPDEHALFYSQVTVKTAGECWPWTGKTISPGTQSRGRPNLAYAVTTFRGMDFYGHRLAWMLANDRRIPTGQLVRHSCHNPRCCNPAHLSLGTYADNNDDMMRAGRHRYGITYGHRPKIEYEEARQIAASGLPSLAAMSREFNRDIRAIKRALVDNDLPVPQFRKTDDYYREIAAGPPMRWRELKRFYGQEPKCIRAAFFRLGLDFDAILIPAPTIDDAYWIEMSKGDAQSFSELERRHHHRKENIRAHFDRLGLPYPPKSRKNITKPTN